MYVTNLQVKLTQEYKDNFYNLLFKSQYPTDIIHSRKT